METYFPNIEAARSMLVRERVLMDLRRLARDAEDLLKATAGDVSDKAKDARKRLIVALERAKATCSELQERAVTAAKAAAMKTDATIREHPYQSIGVAFGLGVLIGVLAAPKQASPP